MPEILVTGFDPFGGENINPAWEAVARLPEEISGRHVVKMQVPTVFEKAARCVIAKAEQIRPEAIICIGQAGGRSAVTPEMVAINLRYASIEDNEGAMPQDVPVRKGGPAAYFSTLPVREMAHAISKSGIPGQVSYSAGTFVCNDLMYALLHHYKDGDTRVGFIHVPYLPRQAKDGVASMPLEDIVSALKTAIECI